VCYNDSVRQTRGKIPPFVPFELEFAIALLPPISRGANGPPLHAQRLVELWKVEENDAVALEQAFRLVDAKAVQGAMMRTGMALNDVSDFEFGDSRYWAFPDLEAILPELRETAWRAMLEGKLIVEAVKGLLGTRRRMVPAAELVRLRPDWVVSCLCRREQDEFTAVRVRRAPHEPVKQRWRKQLSRIAVRDVTLEIAAEYSPGAKPPFDEFWEKLKNRLGPEVTRQVARDALKSFAPQLLGRRGYRSKT
jgi:hypothetical protein